MVIGAGRRLFPSPVASLPCDDLEKGLGAQAHGIGCAGGLVEPLNGGADHMECRRRCTRVKPMLQIECEYGVINHPVTLPRLPPLQGRDRGAVGGPGVGRERGKDQFGGVTFRDPMGSVTVRNDNRLGQIEAMINHGISRKKGVSRTAKINDDDTYSESDARKMQGETYPEIQKLSIGPAPTHLRTNCRSPLRTAGQGHATG
ncbi:MAG: hypothetical protein OXC68_12860 [Aestuariivita sp.]|nr:hypothetical protein [Aestuariivita sp.]